MSINLFQNRSLIIHLLNVMLRENVDLVKTREGKSNKISKNVFNNS